MPPFSVIAGGVTQTQFKALILGSVQPRPTATQTSLRSGQTTRALVTPAPCSASVRAQLDARSIGAYQLFATGLSAGESYVFRVRAGAGNEHALQVRTLPAALTAEGITIAVGSCFYDGFHKDQHLGVALETKSLGGRPILQLWTGDNLYMDVPQFAGRNAAMHDTIERYFAYFLRSGYARVRARMPSYSTFDDHDYWNNYPEGSLWLTRDDDGARDAHVRAASECLDLFQASINPPPVAPGHGRSFSVTIDPLTIFVADTRTNRERNRGGVGRMMTKEDFAMLRATIKSLPGPLVLVLGQPLWIKPGTELSDFNPPAFAEYRELWQLLVDAEHDVLVVSGDVHHSRVLRLSAKRRSIYEYVASPVCHIPTDFSTAVHSFRTQDQAKIDPPDRDPGTGQQAGAEYYFGTNAQNSLGLLRFSLDSPGRVRVGGGFLDLTPTPHWATPGAPENALPRAGRAYTSCLDENLFVLRPRSDYV